ncbi:DUF421 domain-containing protein [Paenibacillus sp. CAA11]|uniref:DUF421 domain-containing protein n=1 Tax=Paenibacillus sp. CAA11 TaxID=1532905 RepID=UPI00131F2858|nr:DUF421 domain-containing protein [Paenibacillus sp. CAA11]
MPEWLEVIIRTLVAIMVLFVMTRLLGKRQISQLSFFEYITGISIGDLAATVSLDLESNWYIGIISLAVWVLVSLGIDALQLKSKRSRKWLEGKSTVLIQDGNIIEGHLKKEKMTNEELLEQLRNKGVFDVGQVEFAIMEPSGKVNVLPKPNYRPLTPYDLGLHFSDQPEPKTVILDGHILEKQLVSSGKNHRWLAEQLKKREITPNEVFLAQINADGELYIDINDLVVKN